MPNTPAAPAPRLLFEGPVPPDVHERGKYSRVRVCQHGEWALAEALNNESLWEMSIFAERTAVTTLLRALAAPTTEQSSAVQQPTLAAPAASEGWSAHLHDAMNRNEYFDVLFRMPNGRYENHAAIWDCCMEMWNLKSYDGAEYLGQYNAIGYRPLPAPAPKPEGGR